MPVFRPLRLSLGGRWAVMLTFSAAAIVSHPHHLAEPNWLAHARE
jgi:hypothetical protein